MPASKHSKNPANQNATSQNSKPASQQTSQKQASKKSASLPSQQASNHAITNFIAENGSGGSLSTDSFPNSSLALKSSPNPQNIRKQTEFEHKSSPNLPEIIYCEQVAAVNLIESEMHENQAPN